MVWGGRGGGGRIWPRADVGARWEGRNRLYTGFTGSGVDVELLDSGWFELGVIGNAGNRGVSEGCEGLLDIRRGRCRIWAAGR